MAVFPVGRGSRSGSSKWMLALFPLITLGGFATALAGLWVLHLVLAFWR